MGGGFLVDMLAVLKPVEYFTPLAVIEFCRGMAAAGQDGKDRR